jgi:hypothetical protein
VDGKGAPLDAPERDAPEVDARAPDAAKVPDARVADARVPDARTVDAKPTPIDAPAGTVDAPMTSIDATQAVDAKVPDAAKAIDAAPACTLVPQTGCESGLACDLDQAKLATAGTYCRAINTAGTESSTCTGFTRCGAGLMCISGACRKFCNADTHCTAPGGKCEIQITYTGGTVPNVKLCTKNCNPVTAAGCPTDQSCQAYAYAGGSKVLTDCEATGVGGQGASCTNASSCQTGFSCVGPTGSSTCLKYCRYDPPVSDCGVNQSCYGFVQALVVGTQEYGVCDTP